MEVVRQADAFGLPNEYHQRLAADEALIADQLRPATPWSGPAKFADTENTMSPNSGAVPGVEPVTPPDVTSAPGTAGLGPAMGVNPGAGLGLPSGAAPAQPVQP